MKIHPVVHVSSLEPYYEDKFGREQSQPPPITVDKVACSLFFNIETEVVLNLLKLET